MWHLEPGDHQTDFLRIVDFVERPPNGGGHLHQMIPKIWWTVEPVIDLLPRDDENVTRSQRVYREEGDTQIVPPNECARDLSFDDPGEDGRHRPEYLGEPQRP